ncbi:MAG: nucleotide exchange factor GrpE [Armatimonadetes bacterium]|nr:nucleotide exchange factor GrpE [Armatimonadota bacterium]
MAKWLRGLLGGGKPPEAPTTEGALAAAREARALRLELEERDRALANLKGELERARAGESARVAAAVSAEWERLAADAAGPVAQLLTQARLLEAEGKPVQAKDVLAVARRLVRVLQEHGLEAVGAVGDAAAFEPNRHEPLGGEAAPAPGEGVVVRLVGIAYRGKVLRKAGVQKG